MMLKIASLGSCRFPRGSVHVNVQGRKCLPSGGKVSPLHAEGYRAVRYYGAIACVKLEQERNMIADSARADGSLLPRTALGVVFEQSFHFKAVGSRAFS